MLKTLRRRLISAPVFFWAGKTLPPLSDTEREALEAGTVWWDAELFSGRPNWNELRSMAKPVLNEEEQAFLAGPTEELCRMIDDWKVNHELRDLPPEVWRFIKDNGFFGLIIPKEHGGLGFSALAHSAVIMKIATRSITAAVTVMVPNSLGPAELLLKYGTEPQKKHYLPRLAAGDEVPCFALTGPHAGSDAASIPDRGIVCYQDVDGERTLGMKVTWDKRYITLGPVATVMGLAFNLIDPDLILGGEEDIGITLALVPTDLPGIEIGRRHSPARQAFQNGPNHGRDVFIPMDWVIGGQDRAGQGWPMLMECLAAGRSVSLPSLGTGAAKFCARTTGAYARVRKQFNLPIGKFEGVQEALARIAGHAYLLEAGRRITAAAVDKGEKPAILSAIMKYHATARMREAVNDAMDVHGGKAICDGPRNYLANIYYAVPVSITVEGANILTRSLIVFGQGAIRCHPYLLREIEAVRDRDRQKGLEDFDDALFGHLGHIFATVWRAFFHNLTGGRWIAAPNVKALDKEYRQLGLSCVSFALIAEVALLILGGRLKRLEFLSGRLGDILSELYLMSCVLKRFEDDGCHEEDRPLLQFCCETSLYTIERRLDEVLRNFPMRPVAWIARRLILPFGVRRRSPHDDLRRRCAELLLEPSPARDRLTEGVFVGQSFDEPTGQLERALKFVIDADAIETKIKKARESGKLEDDGSDSVKQALEAGIIDEGDMKILKEAEKAADAVIAVDDFAPADLTAGPSA